MATKPIDQPRGTIVESGGPVLVRGHYVWDALGVLGAAFAGGACWVDVEVLVSGAETSRAQEAQQHPRDIVVALDSPAAVAALAAKVVAMHIPLGAFRAVSAGFFGLAAALAPEAPPRDWQAHAHAEG